MTENKKVIFEVKDMTCEKCKKRVTSALQEAYPDSIIEIDLGNNHVSIYGGGSKEKLAAIITDAGYTPKAI